jgi:hypothetical protein
MHVITLHWHLYKLSKEHTKYPRRNKGMKGGKIQHLQIYPQINIFQWMAGDYNEGSN